MHDEHLDVRLRNLFTNMWSWRDKLLYKCNLTECFKIYCIRTMYISGWDVCVCVRQDLEQLTISADSLSQTTHRSLLRSFRTFRTTSLCYFDEQLSRRPWQTADEKFPNRYCVFVAILCCFSVVSEPTISQPLFAHDPGHVLCLVTSSSSLVGLAK